MSTILFSRSTTIAILLTSATVARAEKQCFENGFGQIECRNTLSTGARTGIGIGIFVLVLFLLLTAGFVRRRRIRHINQSYIVNPNSGPGHFPQQPYQAQPGYDSQPYAGGQAYQPGFNEAASYPPNSGGPVNAPPGYSSYAPPSGVPPKK